MSAHDFEFQSIDGKTLKLSDFKGKAVLVVNTASECGFTPQYKGLQSLWEKDRGRGLVVLGVPSNDFGAQEPGNEAAIRNFCETRYHVSFPMTAKYAVIGPKAHPFYKWVAKELGETGAPRWNFHKYLIDAQGALAGTFPSKVAPDDKNLAAAIDGALKQ